MEAKVIKETLMSCDVKATENFDSVEDAHYSKEPSGNARIEVLESKIINSKIKLNNATKEANVRSEKGTEAPTRAKQGKPTNE